MLSAVIYTRRLWSSVDSAGRLRQKCDLCLRLYHAASVDLLPCTAAAFMLTPIAEQQLTPRVTQTVPDVSLTFNDTRAFKFPLTSMN